jgi:hypothetical protein
MNVQGCHKVAPEGCQGRKPARLSQMSRDRMPIRFQSAGGGVSEEVALGLELVALELARRRLEACRAAERQGWADGSRAPGATTSPEERRSPVSSATSCGTSRGGDSSPPSNPFGVPPGTIQVPDAAH